MTASFELWDVGAGNVVGSFETEDEALDVVASLLDAYGPDYAGELTLSRRDEAGTSTLIATGKRLAESSGRRAALRRERLRASACA
jgi:hypothetical protein